MIESAVFDTSALIGAALKVGSKPHQALTLAFRHCVLCASDQMLTELSEVLHRSFVDRYLTPQDRDSFLAIIREHFKLYQVDERILQSIDPPCRDANDNFILALALAARAHAIVSSDHDLLVLNPWHGIPVLTPAEFVVQLSA